MSDNNVSLRTDDSATWYQIDQNLPLPREFLFCLLQIFFVCLVTFPHQFCKVYILCCMWPLKSYFTYHSGQLVISLNIWKQKNKTKSKHLQLCSGCVLGHTFHTQAGSFQPCFKLHFCFCRARRSARDESLGPSQAFSVHAPRPGHVVVFQIPRSMWELCKALIFRSISFPSLPPKLLDLFIVCRNYYLLSQVAMADEFVFKCFLTNVLPNSH